MDETTKGRMDGTVNEAKRTFDRKKLCIIVSLSRAV